MSAQPALLTDADLQELSGLKQGGIGQKCWPCSYCLRLMPSETVTYDEVAEIVRSLGRPLPAVRVGGGQPTGKWTVAQLQKFAEALLAREPADGASTAAK